MMDKLDQIFKNALDSQSEPYDPAAWESLSNRLDKQLPPSSNPFKKWGLPSAVLLLGISLASWYVMDASNPEPSQNAQQTVEVEPLKKEDNPQEIQTRTTKEHLKLSLHEEKNESLIDQNEIVTKLTEEQIPEISIPTLRDAVVEQNTSITFDQINDQTPKELFSFTPIELPDCAGMSTELKNTNGFEVMVKSDLMTHSIPPNSSIIMELGAGNIEIIDPTTGVILQKTLVFSPKGDLVVDEIIYENGLPIQAVHVKSDANIQSVHYGKQQTDISNKDFNLYVFEKGSKSVQITLTDEHGCTSKIQGMIHVSEEYNLLAVNAFEPTSQDSRKNTFMPYALTQRATPFRMIILDPNDGGIVFESTDATLPWDGIDRRFGKMGDSNKAYVWKVTLSEPIAGEKSEYMGTVVRM